ncbi:MAG: hypothetical protein ACRC0L_07455, partial [Angustibacter sp.]
QLVPRARLRIDLITASAHTDRLFRLLLPRAVSWIPIADVRRSQVATVLVLAPLPFDQLRTLTEQLLNPQLGRVTWVDRRIARLAIDKVDSCRDSLRWYHAENGADQVLLESRGQLRRALQSVASFSAADAPTSDPRTELQDSWRGGHWLPSRLLRRLVENGASPDAVQVRSPVIEDFTQRSEPMDARLDLDVAVTESQVLDSARDTNAINLLLLAVVAGLLIGQPAAPVQLEVLATVLTLFPAIAASRIERPDMTSLAGVLSQPGYWLSLASAVPGTLLAASMAVLSAANHRWLSLSALVLQGLLHLLIVRRISGGARPGRHEGGRFTLGTQHAPDHGRFDVVRSPWCRSLSADALKLGRPVYAKVVLGPDRPGSFVDLVRGVHQGDPSSNILAVYGTAAAGQALTMLVARDGTWQRQRPAASLIRSVPIDLAQLMPPDPAEWIVEVHLGLPSTIADSMPVAQHPLVTILEAARTHNFRALLVQYPNIPPRVSSLDYRWLRVRIGVPYRRLDSLNRLRKFLEVLREIRRARYDMSVHILPEMATFEASETAPEDAVSTPAAADSADLLRALDIEGRPTTQAERRHMVPLVLCSDSTSPVLSEVLIVLARERPGLRLAALSSAQVHGMAVSFLVFRSSGGVEATALGDLVRAKVPSSARLIPPIDDRFKAEHVPRLPIRRHPREPAAGPILWVRLRASDRIGLMDDLVTRLENMLIRQ